MNLTSIELYSLHISIDTITLNVFTILQTYWVARACLKKLVKQVLEGRKTQRRKKTLCLCGCSAASVLEDVVDFFDKCVLRTFIYDARQIVVS